MTHQYPLSPDAQEQQRDPIRRPAYDAVYEVIRTNPPRATDEHGIAAENARVWRAVEAALDAMLPREVQEPGPFDALQGLTGEEVLEGMVQVRAKYGDRLPPPPDDGAN